MLLSVIKRRGRIRAQTWGYFSLHWCDVTMSCCLILQEFRRMSFSGFALNTEKDSFYYLSLKRLHPRTIQDAKRLPERPADVPRPPNLYDGGAGVEAAVLQSEADARPDSEVTCYTVMKHIWNHNKKHSSNVQSEKYWLRSRLRLSFNLQLWINKVCCSVWLGCWSVQETKTAFGVFEGQKQLRNTERKGKASRSLMWLLKIILVAGVMSLWPFWVAEDTFLWKCWWFLLELCPSAERGQEVLQPRRWYFHWLDHRSQWTSENRKTRSRWHAQHGGGQMSAIRPPAS